jgi:nicotinate-nucleotide pyrophosphorylase (carboxylating)
MQIQPADNKVIDDLIARAFAEDVKEGDVTTNAIVDKDAKAEAVWISKDQGVVAGLGIAERVFRQLDPDLQWQSLAIDGDRVNVHTEIAAISGNARAILTAERIALNIAQRMSGIATKTNRFVEEVSTFDTEILDTRKTMPGLRLLDKYAVEAGGGRNHRMGLYDAALIKDNHIAAAGSIADAVEKVCRFKADLTIEVEAANLEQVDEALAAGVAFIMLDNMDLELMAEAVQQVGGRAKTEASGNVELSNVRAIAETGVDYISVGALTHSVQAFDISQMLEKIW